MPLVRMIIVLRVCWRQLTKGMAWLFASLFFLALKEQALEGGYVKDILFENSHPEPYVEQKVQRNRDPETLRVFTIGCPRRPRAGRRKGQVLPIYGVEP